MELDEDYSVTVPLIFTVLAVLLATLIIKLRKVPSQEAQEEEKEIVEELREETEKKEEELDREKTEAGVPVEEVGTVDDLPQEEVKEEEQEIVTEQSAPQERRGSSHSSQEEDSKEEDFDAESDKVLKISEADDADDESLPFQYLPGKLRGSEFEKMLTKEELEEEQRVKREQLGAIFQMMENKQETFGEMSERDLNEQTETLQHVTPLSPGGMR